jgi:hypothetical protein
MMVKRKEATLELKNIIRLDSAHNFWTAIVREALNAHTHMASLNYVNATPHLRRNSAIDLLEVAAKNQKNNVSMLMAHPIFDLMMSLSGILIGIIIMIVIVAIVIVIVDPILEGIIDRSEKTRVYKVILIIIEPISFLHFLLLL